MSDYGTLCHCPVGGRPLVQRRRRKCMLRKGPCPTPAANSARHVSALFAHAQRELAYVCVCVCMCVCVCVCACVHVIPAHPHRWIGASMQRLDATAELLAGGKLHRQAAWLTTPHRRTAACRKAQRATSRKPTIHKRECLCVDVCARPCMCKGRGKHVEGGHVAPPWGGAYCVSGWGGHGHCTCVSC
jgi:hypothetical protein